MSENNKRHHDDEEYAKARRNLVIILVIMTAGFVVSLLCGCKGLEKVVTVEKTRTDTVFQKQTQLDSVWEWCHDSIVTKERSDTVTIERWHWSDRWRERVVRDTVYKSRVDTVPMPYPVVKMVEKELSMWQKVRMHAGEAVLAILGGGVVLAIVRRRIFGG